MILKDIYDYFYNKKLQDHQWLNKQIHTYQRTIKDIASEINCSDKCLEWKLNKYRKSGLISKDEMSGLFTGPFHTVCKKIIVFLIKPFTNKIQKSVDELYPHIKSRNGRILKEIIEEMNAKDQDIESSMARSLKLTRKDFYLLIARFGIVLYEVDDYYSERMTFIIKKISEKHDKFYIDELADPTNWYPTRPMFYAAKSIALRNFDENVGYKVTYITKNKDGTININRLKKEKDS